MKRNKIFKIVSFLFLATMAQGFMSCEETDSDLVAFVEDNNLNTPNDTVYSLLGIIGKMQVVADRTVLLGELRGELTTLTENASLDLQSIANFDVDTENPYNNARDFYGIIQNCNYFISKADSLLMKRGRRVFEKELAVVRTFRAWTYLQLAINYGRVPYVTEPILTKEDAERLETQNIMGIKEICNELIRDLTPLTADRYLQLNGEHSFYGDIGYRTSSMFFYFPVKLLLGELNLWAGNYKQAAEWYYRYISSRNGDNSTYPTGMDNVSWMSSSWNGISMQTSWPMSNDLVYSQNHEIITVIPGDSIPRNGTYLQLRNIFNSFDPVTNEYHEVSLVPSQGLIDLSAAQVYCLYENRDTLYAPANVGFEDYMSGDLRLYSTFQTSHTIHNDQRAETQTISKHRTRNAIIWRRQMIWLHLAEALNHAGYPRFAYQILSSGINNKVIQDEVIPYYRADSVWLSKFDFPNTRYVVDSLTNRGSGRANMQGMHSRGSGVSYINQYYQLPDDTLITDSLARIAYQQNGVDKMIADEGALEFAFEGQRYYDLVRMALYRNEPSFLADRIYNRRGEAKRPEMESLITKPLTDPNNWFLRWNGKLGM